MPRPLKTAPFTREHALWESGVKLVAGTDEVGRGCLAGPVIAAAVVFPEGMEPINGLYDSKAVSKTRREALMELVHERALGVGVGVCSPAEIDEMNIRNASLEAMVRAVEDLPVVPDHVLVDGNVMPPDMVGETIVKGDANSHSIAAASIVAKVTRDRLMEMAADECPGFECWKSNKGYPAPAHYDALEAHGPNHHHRRSFRLKRKRM